MKRIILTACLSFLPLQALAETGYYNGNDLLTRCNADPGLAAAYLAGIVDGTTTIQIWDGITGYACVPESATLQQLTDIVCRDLRTKVSERHLSASSLAMNSLLSAFPCR